MAPPPPLAWLGLNDDLSDQSAQAILHNGTLVNLAGLARFTNDVPNAVAGVDSLYLPGDGSYVDLANPTNLVVNSGNAFTISAWIRTSSNGVIVAKSTSDWTPGSTGTHTLAFYVNASGNLVADVFWQGAANSSSVVNNDQWTHVAVTYDGSTFRLYINGQADGSGSFGAANQSAPTAKGRGISRSGTRSTPTTPNRMAATETSTGEQVAFWSAQLTPTEVLDVFSAGIPKAGISVTQQPVVRRGWPAGTVIFSVVGAAVGTASP